MDPYMEHTVKYNTSIYIILFFDSLTFAELFSVLIYFNWDLSTDRCLSDDSISYIHAAGYFCLSIKPSVYAECILLNSPSLSIAYDSLCSVRANLIH